MSRAQANALTSSLLSWAVRLFAGAVSILLAILGDTAFVDILGTADPPVWFVLVALTLHLSSAFVAYGAFFYWRRSRIIPTSDSKNVRLMRVNGVILLGVGVLAGLIALVAVLGLSGTTAADSTIWVIAFLLFVSGASIISGVGLWRDATWSLAAARFTGFLYFGGVPIGTILALSLWWVAAHNSELQAQEPQ